MTASRLFWAVVLGSILVVGAAAVPAAGFLWGHGPSPHDHAGARYPGGGSNNSSTRYAVAFQESGLPTGTSWSVQIWALSWGPSAPHPVTAVVAPFWHDHQVNSSTSETVGFALANGSYAFTVDNASRGSTAYTPSPASGTFWVNGSGVTESVSFSAVHFYTLTFTESGLPNGTFWSVELYGAFPSNGSRFGPDCFSGIGSSSSSIPVNVTNGSYGFVVPNVSTNDALYLSDPSAGSVSVNGSNLVVNITFMAEALYNVTFVETGLPNGTFWFVSLFSAWAGGGNAPGGSSVSFEVPAGTYGFYVQSAFNWSGPIYVPSPQAGNLTVEGNVTVNVTFSALPTFTVSLVESGLPNGTAWYAGLFGGGPLGFAPAGVPPNVGPSWGTFLYNGSTGTTLSFTVPNGSYSFFVENVSDGTNLYTPSPAFGNVSVSGSGVTVNIAFSHESIYTVTFVETGLPNGTFWGAVVCSWASGCEFNVSANSSLSFNLTNGTYNFSVGALWEFNGSSGSVATPSFGTVVVNGSNVTVSVTFAPPPLYAITFVESGLPGGANWSFALDGTFGVSGLSSAANSSLTVDVVNGSYGFYVGPVDVDGVWYTASPECGALCVDGATVTVDVTFAPST